MDLMCELTHRVSSVVKVGNQLSSVKEQCGEHVMKLWCIVGEVVVQLRCSFGEMLVQFCSVYCFLYTNVVKM
jgi:hypothetical protein